MTAELSPDGGEGQGAAAGSGPGGAVEPTAAVGNGTGSSAGTGAEAGLGAASKGEGRREAESGGVWDDVVLDEDFIRSADTAEPSARARMLAARWREKAPDPQPWRSDEPPAGWFFSKARRRRWRRR